MKKSGRYVAAFVAVVLVAAGMQPAPLVAQRGAGADARGLEETIWAIQRARVVTRILYITAHPDDEAGALLSYLARGAGADVSLLTLTRGEGGQNAIGPELGPRLGAIRSEELFEATQIQGVKLYFTRAPDFGFSKTMDETLRIWGDRALADMVYVIRKLRPQIVINGWDTVRTGHGNHQASGYLTPKAVEAAADPKMFPEQLGGEIQPWRAPLVLQPVRGEGSGWTVPVNEISPLWGESYVEFGIEALAHHRSQGVVGFTGSPFLRRAPVLMRSDGGALDSSKLAEPLVSLADRFPNSTGRLRPALEECEKQLAAAERAARQLDWPEAARALAKAALQAEPLQGVMSTDAGAEQGALGWELHRVRERIENALRLAAGFQMEATADRSVVTAGEKFGLRVEWRYRPGFKTQVAKPEVLGPKGLSAAEEQSEAGMTRFSVSLPADATPRPDPDAWMLPAPPPLVQVFQLVTIANLPMWVTANATALRVTSTRVDTLPVVLAPAVTLALEPRQFLLSSTGPARGTTRTLELFARVHYYGTHAARVTLGLDAPKDWNVETPAPVEFQGAGDHLVRFRVTLPAQLAAGETNLQAWAKVDSERFTTSLEPLPSLPTRMMSEPATAQVRVLDLNVPAGLRVGYIAAENDPVPHVLGQLGIRVEMLDEVALAFGDLSKYDAICIGIRAYELRSDLARANARLLDYARTGGTLVVQYQRQSPWNQVNPAPYAATISPQTLRTTDENSPVRYVVPDHPVVRFPNQIKPDDWTGWIQERGLYYWGQWDKQFQPILALRDPGEEETLGSLLYARTGKGVYIYTGLAFFRQLPAGVPGAVRLFVNLLSQGKRPGAK